MWLVPITPTVWDLSAGCIGKLCHIFLNLTHVLSRVTWTIWQAVGNTWLGEKSMWHVLEQFQTSKFNNNFYNKRYFNVGYGDRKIKEEPRTVDIFTSGPKTLPFGNLDSPRHDDKPATAPLEATHSPRLVSLPKFPNIVRDSVKTPGNRTRDEIQEPENPLALDQSKLMKYIYFFSRQKKIVSREVLISLGKRC